VIAGTYEHFLVGYTVTEIEEDGEKKYTYKQSFTNNSSSGNITALTTVGKHLISGSSDEIIRLINMEARVEHGCLQKQEGTITHLTNFEDQFLFSGSEDGTICIWKSGSWICEKTLKGHIGGVIGISVHPSGKLALSVGKDRALKTWNLIKGRSGFVTNLKGVADAVQWSTEGTYYAVSIANRVDVYSTETAKVEYTLSFDKRASRVLFLQDDVLLVAGDKEAVEVHSVAEKTKLVAFDAHKNRVKDAVVLPEHNMVLTASNDGFIKLWSFDEDDYTSKPSLLTQIDTACRITCLAVFTKTFEDKNK
jgi:protein MAK11